MLNKAPTKPNTAWRHPRNAFDELGYDRNEYYIHTHIYRITRPNEQNINQNVAKVLCVVLRLARRMQIEYGRQRRKRQLSKRLLLNERRFREADRKDLQKGRRRVWMRI